MHYPSCLCLKQRKEDSEMKSRTLTLLTTMTLFAALAVPVRLAAQEQKQDLPHYTVTDLGTLGGTFSLAGGLSNSGWVEGYSTLPGDTVEHAFLWRKGAMIDLGTLGGPNSDASWRPNNRGNAGGGSDTTTLDPNAENFCGHGTNLICLPFLWRNSTKKMTALPTLGGNNAWVAGVNNWDAAVGVAENNKVEPTCAGTSQVLQFKPALWIWGRVYPLPTFPGDPVGNAYSINDWGQATGSSGNCRADLHALLWQNGKALDLGSLGGTRKTGVDINNQGQVVGDSLLPGDNAYHAFLWQRGVMTDLGTLPGDISSTGEGINSKGQVVGGSYDASGNPRPFLWQDGVMTDLNTLIPPNSPLYLLEATGTINDRGQIAGYALVISTGEVHAFLATPTTTHWAISDRPKVVLPENARRLVQQRRGGRFGVKLARPQ